MAMLKIGSLFALCASAHANILSPGLGKCLQVQPASTLGTGAAYNLELTTCTSNEDQHYKIVKGLIHHHHMCLTADAAAANANVHVANCTEGSTLQNWKLTHFGQIMLGDTNQCLDVKAALKADGTREKWDEIKAKDVVNVHLYTCHDPTTTDRVNQLWTWAPFVNGQQVGVKTAVSTPACLTCLKANETTSSSGTAATNSSGGSGTAATGGTASMPTNVAAAVAAQTNGLLNQYLDDHKQELSTTPLASRVWMCAGVAVTSFVALVGVFRWFNRNPSTASEEEAAVLDEENSQF